MGSRRRAREYALQALYAVELSGAGGPEALDGTWARLLDDPPSGSEPASPDEQEFAAELVRGVIEERAAIDAMIETASEHWRLARMPMVDRNVIRLGAYELKSRPDIPTSVSINEAVELAKKFGGAESKSFVNGLLDRIASELGRGGRRSRGK